MLNIDNMKRRLDTEVAHLIEAGAKVIGNDSRGEYVLTGPAYTLGYTLNKKWTGYDFAINKKLTGGIPVGLSEDTDNYDLHYDEKVSEEIFENMIRLLGQLLSGDISYGVLKRGAFIAVKLDQGEGYRVKIYKPFRIFKWTPFIDIDSEIWSLETLKQYHGTSILIK